MTDYNIALIGCGRIGHILEEDSLRNKPCTHFGGVQGAGLKITHGCDNNQERLENFSKVSGIQISSLYLNHLDLFRENSLDCAIIATPTPFHFKIAKNAILSGVKLLVIEKPVSSSLKEARELIYLQQKYDVRIFVNHERRYDYRYQSAKRIIEHGGIGNITSITGIMGTGPYRGQSNIIEGGGPLLHDGTHLVDIISYFAGKCNSLSGSFIRETRKSGYEDTAHAWLHFDKDISAYIESGGCKKYFSFEVDITGTEGRIQIGNGFNRLFKTEKSKLYQGFKDLKEVTFPLGEKSNCFTNLYKEVKKNLESPENLNISSTLMDGYHSLEIIHGIYYSSFRKNKNIKLPLAPYKVNLKKIFTL